MAAAKKVKIKVKANGRIDRSVHDVPMVPVGDWLEWQCDEVDFAVVDIKELCDEESESYLQSPFSDVVPNKRTTKGTPLKSGILKSAARGKVYKATWVAISDDGTVDVWDPHFIVWP